MSGNVLSAGQAAMVLFGVFVGLLVLRVPVAFALGLACLPILLIEPRLSMMMLAQETFNAYNSFILLSVPFFLLTANLMSIGGLAIAVGLQLQATFFLLAILIHGVDHHAGVPHRHLFSSSHYAEVQVGVLLIAGCCRRCQGRGNGQYCYYPSCSHMSP